MKRKQFIKAGLATVGLASLPKIVLADGQGVSTNFSLEEIKEFVFAAHRSYEETKTIVERTPLLLNCANQAKKGDFETALGGAAHMGRKDIAMMLVGKGARMDIYSMCFLGHIDFVKQLLVQYPHLLESPGPHGFTLLHHAIVGKHDEFAKWLRGEGLSEERFEDAF